uniref:E3 ubiquitin/ISG15 ligase TRIM25-like n=1 Tax=Petromyzon marinus TaxID=7757 RepID=A0AAJ7UJF1_PETMA|nr:E3 ubiquitin/ISG15 ligase TRIM25-like [Petromyzon marinus]
MSTPAAAAASEELICSICLGAYNCPSTLSCGHSFCLRCLEDTWQVAGRCFCPQCRAKFKQKPQLSKNVALANLVEELSVGEKAAPQVSCNCCLDGEVPTVRSCLTCETSISESHCKHHLQNARFKEHELVEMGVSTEDRMCKKHKKRLAFNCTQDESLVCTSCAIVGAHTGHKFSSVEEEHGARKESLWGTKEQISREFERRREQLGEEEREALERVDEEGRSVVSRIQADIARYESKAGGLDQEINQLLAALKVHDPLAFLQHPVHENLRSSDTQGIQDAPPPTFSHQELTEVISLGGVKTKLMGLVYEDANEEVKHEFDKSEGENEGEKPEVGWNFMALIVVIALICLVIIITTKTS